MLYCLNISAVSLKSECTLVLPMPFSAMSMDMVCPGLGLSLKQNYKTFQRYSLQILLLLSSMILAEVFSTGFNVGVI